MKKKIKSPSKYFSKYFKKLRKNTKIEDLDEFTEYLLKENEKITKIFFSEKRYINKIYSNKIKLLKEENFTDELTNVFNKKYFYSNLLSEDKRFLFSGIMAFIDLNNFKSINDTYGHSKGDEVLKYFSNKISEKLRKTDILFRYAGDEFIILFKNNNKDFIMKKMLKIQKEYQKEKFKIEKKKFIDLSFSFGIVEFNKRDKYKKIVKIADLNMYKNKKKGKQ
jgi:diguanylate cyclase (GGDEF)-like protein